MFKKVLILTLCIFLVLVLQVGVNAVPGEVISFSEELNNALSNLENTWINSAERDGSLVDKFYLSEELLSESIDTENNYVVDFFDDPAVAIELVIDYREDTGDLYLTVWNLQGNREVFLKTNYETAHLAEVLVHTVEEQNSAEQLVENLRIFDFWSDTNLENIAAYDLLEFDLDGAFYFNSIDDFYIGFDIHEGSFPDGFDISYSGSWER